MSVCESCLPCWIHEVFSTSDEGAVVGRMSRAIASRMTGSITATIAESPYDRHLSAWLRSQPDSQKLTSPPVAKRTSWAVTMTLAAPSCAGAIDKMASAM